MRRSRKTQCASESNQTPIQVPEFHPPAAEPPSALLHSEAGSHRSGDPRKTVGQGRVDRRQILRGSGAAVQQVSHTGLRLMELHQALLSSFDFDAVQIFTQLSSNGEAITGEDIVAFMADQQREVSPE
jgi:hypothetical protein